MSLLLSAHLLAKRQMAVDDKLKAAKMTKHT